MKEPEEILKISKNFFKKKKMFKGINALITAGPTQSQLTQLDF